MCATKMDGLRLLKMVQAEIKSLETEGYKRIGEVQLGTCYLVHLYNRTNGNCIMLKVYRTYCVIEKNHKVIKVIK